MRHNIFDSIPSNIVSGKDNVFASQFHPEKSSTVGLAILKNFIEVPAPAKED